MDVEMSFPAHSKAAELVQQSEGLFDDVAQRLDSGQMSACYSYPVALDPLTPVPPSVGECA